MKARLQPGSLESNPLTSILVRLRTAFDWRGQKADGWPLGSWLGVLALAWCFARLLFVWEPAALFFPRALAVGVAFPVLQACSARLTSTRWAHAEPLIAAVTLALVALNVFDFVIRRQVPIDVNDNQMYIARAEIISRALGEGQLPQWSHLFLGGDPQLDLYGWFTNLVVALLHRMVIPNLPIEAAYTAVSIAAWWLRGLAVYLLARRFAGPLIAVALTTSSLLDIGQGIWEGTWNPGFSWGLIHSNVAVTFCILSLAHQISCIRRPSRGRIVCVAFFVAISAFAHPIAIVVQAAVLGALVITRLCAKDAHRETIWTLAATVVGLLLCGWWIFPQVNALANFGFSFAAGGENYLRMGQGLLSGTLPGSSFGGFVGLAFVAVVAALTMRRAECFFPAMATTGLWCLALEPLGLESQLFVHLPNLLGGQLIRLLVAASAFAFAPLAWSLGTAFAHLHGPSSLRPVPVLSRSLVAALLLLGPGRSLNHALEAQKFALRDQFPAKTRAPWKSQTSMSSEQQAAFDWLADTRKKDPSPTPWRASMHFGFDHQFASWASGVHTGVPAVQYTAQIVGVMLANRPRELSVQGFHDWNVRYVVTEGQSPPVTGLTSQYEVGNVHVWSVPDYDDRFVVAPQGVSIKALRLDTDRIHFEVEGAPPQGVDVRVRVAWFPRWRAHQGTNSLTVNSAPPRPDASPKQEQILLHVGNGGVDLDCEGPLPMFRWGVASTALAMLLLGFFAQEKRRSKLEALLLRWGGSANSFIHSIWSSARHRPVIAGIVTATILLSVSVTAAFSGRRRLTFAPVSNTPLEAWAKIEDRDFRPCTAAFWAGRYVCPNGTVLIEPGLGTAPILDSTNEWPRLWPGTAVDFRKPNTTARLVLHRMAAGGNKLKLDIWVEGEVQGQVKVAGKLLLERRWEGHLSEQITIPDSLPSVADVELQMAATKPVRVVFSGSLVRGK